MFPIPVMMIMTDTGVVPLPAGIVKKVITLDYPNASGTSVSSLALLLNDGRLFTQGANTYGEIADGTRTARYNTFYLASTVASDVFPADRCFVVKFQSGGWQYAGLTAGLVGSTAAGGADVCAVTWTSFPSSITGTITLANLKEVKGGYNNTLWLMTTGVLYGSGQNTVGSLGASNTNQVSTPRQITSVALGFDAGYNQCTYLNNAGALRVCGASKGVAGNNSTTTAFVSATISSTETVYVKDYINTVAQTIVIGDTAAGAGSTNYLYVRSNTDTTYTKLATFSTGFGSWVIPPSHHSSFVSINNALWAIGKNYTASLGLGYDSASTDPLQTGKPSKPTGVPSWDVTKLTSVHMMSMDVTSQLGYQGTFFVYDGNLFYSGVTKDSKAPLVFNGTLGSNKFSPIASTEITGDVLATSLSTDSLGICIVGGSKQLTYSVSPEGGKLFNEKYTTSAPAYMTVSATGLMTFVAEGGFDAGMSAVNAVGTALSDSSYGYGSVLEVYTPSISAMEEGTTFQLVAEITPDGAASLPGMVVVYSSNDTSVATVDPTTGVITAVADGDCRIACTATYQGVVTASDSSYLAVNAPVMDYDLTQATLPTGVQISGGNYFSRASGDTLATTTTLVAPLEYVGTTAIGRRPTANARTHLFINNALSAATTWVKTNATAPAASVNSPLGTTANVFNLTPSTASGTHLMTATYTNSDMISVGRDFVASSFFKANGITKVKLRITAGSQISEVTADLSAGIVSGTDSSIVALANGWYRITTHMQITVKQTSITMQIIALDASGAESFTGTGTSYCSVWLPQMEMAAKAGTPYICTASTNIGGVSFAIPKNAHTGVAVYYSNGDVVREAFTGTATTWTLLYQDLYHWGTNYITGLKYYD